MPISSRLASLVLVVPLALACGNALEQPPDLTLPQDLSVVDRTPPPDLVIPLRDAHIHPPPVTISSHGGRTLQHIDVVTVQWEGDDLGPERQEFAAWMVDSEYFDTLIEYGVHRGTARGPYTIKAPFPTFIDDSQVGPLLRSLITNGTIPAAGPDTLYILYLPEGTDSSLQGMPACQSYGGYHSFTPSGVTVPKQLPYAVIPACYTGLGRFDADLLTISHEIAEAASDPAGGGWYGDGPLSEISDLCNPLSYDYEVTPPGDGGVPRSYTVARNWSAATAAANDSDPCLPVPGLPYEWFNAPLEPNDVVITLDQEGKGTATFEVQPFSYGSVSKVISWDLQLFYPPAGVSFSTRHGTGLPGSTQKVTVTAVNSDYGMFPIFVEARSGIYRNVWYGTLTIQ